MWLFFAKNCALYLRNSVLGVRADSNLKASQQQSGLSAVLGSDSPASSATSPPAYSWVTPALPPACGSEALRAECVWFRLREVLAAGAQGKGLSPTGACCPESPVTSPGNHDWRLASKQVSWCPITDHHKLRVNVSRNLAICTTLTHARNPVYNSHVI